MDLREQQIEEEARAAQNALNIPKEQSADIMPTNELLRESFFSIQNEANEDDGFFNVFKKD